jgi:hypothetical protein
MPVYLGSKQEKMRLIVDSASDWVSVLGSECTNCLGDTYDVDKSRSAEQISYSQSLRSYGDAYMTGEEFTDEVCVQDLCAEDFKIFVGIFQSGFERMTHGVMGLSH